MMLAILAVICFVLALFEVSVGTVNLVVLGLAFVAAHLAFSAYVPDPLSRNR